MNTGNLQLVYTLLCDDVRLEMSNKISIMGIFQHIMVESLPTSIVKFAIVNHWRGEGFHQTEVRIMSPNKDSLIITSQPTPLELATGGFTDNVSFFAGVIFPHSGTYWVQTLANSQIVEEFPLIVVAKDNLAEITQTEEITQTVN